MAAMWASVTDFIFPQYLKTDFQHLVNIQDDLVLIYFTGKDHYTMRKLYSSTKKDNNLLLQNFYLNITKTKPNQFHFIVLVPEKLYTFYVCIWSPILKTF